MVGMPMPRGLRAHAYSAPGQAGFQLAVTLPARPRAAGPYSLAQTLKMAACAGTAAACYWLQTTYLPPWV